MTVFLFIIRFILFHAFQQPGEIIEVARVNIQVEQVSVAVEEFVGGEGIDTKVALDGRLLLGGQVVVGDVGAADVVLLDDVLP